MTKTTKYLTVGEIKNILEKYNDDTPIGGTGHFGEILEVQIEGTSKALNKDWQNDLHKGKKPFEILEISMDDKGPEPD